MTTSDVRTTIQEAMRAAFPKAEERVAHFYAMQEYHLGWRDVDLQPAMLDPGKLLRPQLALLACRAVGGDVAQAMPLAAAIQLIHDFSLIHDDIEDNSDMRRGRVTVWKQWGLAHGVNVGDGMFIIAHLSLYRLADVGVPAPVVLDVMRRFDQTILKVCEGQFLDLSFEGNRHISEDDYLAMISCKTAALIAGAASMGAVVGDADAESVQALFNYGQSLGLAFQIQDDVLGIWGDPELTGKPRAADLYRRKVSLPVIHALRNAADRDELERIYRQAEVSDDDVARVLRILDAVDARSYSDTLAAYYDNQALRSLDRVRSKADADAEQALAQIRSITRKLLGRQT